MATKDAPVNDPMLDPVTGEFAKLNATSPIDPIRHDSHNSPIDESRSTSGPAKCLIRNINALT